MTQHGVYTGSMMNNRLTLLEARQALHGARMETLAKLAIDSVRGSREMQNHPAFDSTTLARGASNLFYFHAPIEFASDPGVRLGESGGQKYLVFDERFLIRFKLLDDNFESSNFPTEQAVNFVRQSELTNFPPFDRTHLGYRLDITGRVVGDMFVTLPTGIKGAFNAWMWQVWGDRVGETTTYGTPFQLRFPGIAAPIYAYDDYRQVI